MLLFNEWRTYLNKDKLMPYFSKFRDIAKSIDKKLNWEHIDIFFIRETNQKTVKQIREKYPEFFQNQLSLSIEIIEELNPKIIIITSAFASRILKEN